MTTVPTRRAAAIALTAEGVTDAAAELILAAGAADRHAARETVAGKVSLSVLGASPGASAGGMAAGPAPPCGPQPGRIQPRVSATTRSHTWGSAPATTRVPRRPAQ